MAKGTGEDLQRSRLPVVLQELRALVEPVALLRRIAAELILANERLELIAMTSRFNRGGYDGPFIVGRTYTLGPEAAKTPAIVFSGRGYPVALLIEITGTGVATDELFISDDNGAMTQGLRVSLTANSTLRIIADTGQEYYAQPGFTGLVSSTTMSVREGRL
mgnify:CR=1 FL=1